jgi:hypothetical protein
MLLPVSAVRTQELQHVRDAVAGRDSAPSSASSGDDWLGALNCALGDDAGAFWFFVAASPFVIPARIMGDTWEEHSYLPWYPYPRQFPGWLLPRETSHGDDVHTDSDGVHRRLYAGRLSIEGGSDFNGVDRLAVQLRLDSAYRVGVLTSWNYYSERLACGCRDRLVIGDFNIIVRFAENAFAAMYSGAGFRTLIDRSANDFGFNFVYGFDWFPMRPIVVGASLEAGTLGAASVFHTRATVGAVYRRWELYGGYDFLRIGSVNLQGPMVGLRLWF